MEISALRQKANIHWLKEGDLNILSFHSVVKDRTSRYRIDFLKDDRGVVVEEERQIKKLVTDFYSKLLGCSVDSLTGINIQAMRNGHQISHP